MSEKNINTRIVHKHDTEENWNKATNFIPKMGEIIVYDVDSTYSYERFKIGDGKTVISLLPFSIATAIPNAEIDEICSATISSAEEVLL